MPIKTLESFLRPAVVQAPRDPLAPAVLGDAVLAAQPGEHDPDLLLRRMLPDRPADLSFTHFSAAARCVTGFWLISTPWRLR